jgi:hypothetical protein
MRELFMPDENHVIRAIKECDKLGLNKFLKKYGFGKERKFALIYHEGTIQEFPSKAIWGVAHLYDPAFWKVIKGNGGINPGCAASALLHLGFQIKNKITGVLLNKNHRYCCHPPHKGKFK